MAVKFGGVSLGGGGGGKASAGASVRASAGPSVGGGDSIDVAARATLPVGIDPGDLSFGM